MGQTNLLGLTDEQFKCPLMGVTKGMSSLQQCTLLVVGTEECTYYTKATLSQKGGAKNIFSVIYDNHDITFGGVDKVEKAAEELFEGYSVEVLLIVTTCCIEVIGDDLTALSKQLEEKHGKPVRVIQTNHFKTDNQEEGFAGLAKAASSALNKEIKPEMLTNKNKGKKMSPEMLQKLRQKFGESLSDKELMMLYKQKQGEKR